MVHLKINTIKDGTIIKTKHYKFPQAQITLGPYLTEINVDYENKTLNFDYEFKEQNVFNVIQKYNDPINQEEHNICRVFMQPMDRTPMEIPKNEPDETRFAS